MVCYHCLKVNPQKFPEHGSHDAMWFFPIYFATLVMSSCARFVSQQSPCTCWMLAWPCPPSKSGQPHSAFFAAYKWQVKWQQQHYSEYEDWDGHLAILKPTKCINFISKIEYFGSKLDLQSVGSSPDLHRGLIQASQIQWSELEISLTP